MITHPDKKIGRGQTIAPNALAEWAGERELHVAKPADISEINKHLLEVQPQLVITASYGRMIPPELLHGPRFGWLNVHYSLLPRWRGAAPVQWAILEGDEISGFSIFKLDKGMDTGPIYLQEEVHLGDEATTETVLRFMSERSGERILEVIEEIASGRKPKPQSTAGITLAPKISKEMGQIDWANSGLAIVRKVRALSDKPGTYSFLRGQKIALHQATISHLSSSSSRDRGPGEIWSEDGLVLVQSQDVIVELGEITPAGKKRMSATDYLRGLRLSAGESFTNGE